MHKKYLKQTGFTLMLLTGVIFFAKAQTVNKKTVTFVHQLLLVKNGHANCVLVIPKNAAPGEAEAAGEIQNFVQKISGVKLEIISAEKSVDQKLPVLIGEAAPAELVQSIREKGDDPYSFALVAEPGRICLRGLSPAGTRVAAYELLEQLGVRWFMPGDLGTVVPNNKIVQLAEQKTIQVPSFAARWTTSARNSKKLGEEWMQRVRMGGPNFPSSHGITIEEKGSNDGAKGKNKSGEKKTKSLFEEHPEYYALVDGKRKPSQLCVSNHEVLKLAIATTKQYFRNNPDAEWIGMGPNDGRGFCECDNCKALDAGDYDPIAHQISMTDRYVGFFNKVLEGIKDEFPAKKIGFYAYAAYMRPPVKVKPDPKIVPATAVIGLCRLHGMGNPICPEKSYEKQLTTDWGKIVPEVYNRGYWYNLSDPGLPFFMISRVKNEIPIGKALGIHGWRVETSDNLAAELPSIYIAAKLMWDDKADVNALMTDFCSKFFGPAALPMRRYIDLMDQALYNADYHTGSAWDFPHIYNKPVCNAGQASLNQARKLATGVYAKRVDMYLKDFNYLLAFNNMLEQRLANNYVAAQRSLDVFDTIGRELINHDPPLLKPLHVVDYTKRFFRATTEQGYKRVTNGNQMIAGFKKDWEVALDPERIGVAIGLWRPDNKGGNWQKLSSDYSWGDQGLRYYKGLAWYRQRVMVPKGAAGKKLFLWFGGVDEKAQVWVNGKFIGTSGVGTFQPFELDAANAVKPGAENVFIILITNDKLNELGTGGIIGPVMIWSPKDPGAKPENGTGAVKDESMETIMQKSAAPNQ